ncbi:T9SS type A sorting domain-containing protein [Lentimicrobium sp. L6]|uniref:Ig-like domain-containing protein n=1 Tax=Lentimicrobium sp. L6 TaxID=2735916 RepID=UPI001551A822|nr:T9SS type A sorting domain-containing protein [Lentimicrobium sp. L6]NPD85133.1 T9SS type A sorting domain-containing protein [Lentimicrobium sp. L6]
MKTHFYFIIFLFIFSFSTVYAQRADDPVAVDDSVIMMHYGTIHINVLANDYDPNGEAIHIDDLDEEEGFEISFQDSIVTIKALIYYDWEYLSIDYRIRNESGETDRADIDIYFEDNPSVPVPVRDIFDLECQKSQIINLVENDEYTGSENLIITDITSSNVEILADSQSVKYTAGLKSGKTGFSYRVKEQGGNGYVSKKMNNFAYVRGNPEAPYGIKDTFNISMGETKTFDVLGNDESLNPLVLDTIGLPAYAQIENNKLKITCPDAVSYDLNFDYQAYDGQNGYYTWQTRVMIQVVDKYRRPLAIVDSLEYDFADTVFIRPLDNDYNYANTPLVLNDNNDTIFTYYYTEPSMQHFNRWTSREYRCKNEGSDLLSEQVICNYRITPPDSIQVEEDIFYIRLGESLDFNPRSYTNLPDSLSLWAVSIEELGEVTANGDIVSFTIDPEVLPSYYISDFIGELVETIRCDYGFEFNGIPQYISQYFTIKIDIHQNVSYLDINNFSIPVTPFGLHFNKTFKPTHKYIKANNFLEQIRPWIANDHNGIGDVQFSGDIWCSNNTDFINGPIKDAYHAEYDSKYFRTWMVTKSQIDYHMAHFNDEDYQIPEIISNWPADIISFNGLDYEQADYVDFDQNGVYNPENGDFPKISGDKAILYLINDGRLGDYRAIDSLNIDIYALIYAFDRPESDLFQNTFFMKYKIINKSDIDYTNFRLAQLVLHDDYNMYNHMGCDTILNTFYSYPVAGNENQYVGMTTFLNHEMGKFLTYGDVDSDPRYKYANMMGIYNSEFPIQNPPLWMNWSPLNYVFPSKIDDPYGSNAFAFDERNSFYGTGDGLGSAEALELKAGGTQYYDIAYSVYNNQQDGVFELVDIGLDRVSQLIECYQNDSIPGGGSFTGIHEQMNNTVADVLIYPNPARTTLYIQTENKDFETYRIYSLHGQLLEESKFESEISIQHLPPGFYFLQLMGKNGKVELTRKFVKQ